MVSRPTKMLLIWAKDYEGKSQQTLLDAAKVFFGSFNGGKQKMSKDIKKLKEENKSRKRLAHKNLMKHCGGGGKKEIFPLMNMYLNVLQMVKCVTFAKRFSTSTMN